MPQVFYFEKMEVNDFRNDVLLAEACREDVDKFCKNVEPGGCLRLHASHQRWRIAARQRARAGPQFDPG